ncbi:MAG TPA: hypothetical protein VHE37_15365 [Nevskiaceae bacterium]|nr:hypothetical protein [Nevskiaceae bacterium]
MRIEPIHRRILDLLENESALTDFQIASRLDAPLPEVRTAVDNLYVDERLTRRTVFGNYLFARSEHAETGAPPDPESNTVPGQLRVHERAKRMRETTQDAFILMLRRTQGLSTNQLIVQLQISTGRFYEACKVLLSYGLIERGQQGHRARWRLTHLGELEASNLLNSAMAQSLDRAA